MFLVVQVSCLWLASGSVILAEEPQAATGRVPFTNSRVVGSPAAPLPYEVTPLYPDLRVKAPVFLVADPVPIRSPVRFAPGQPFEKFLRLLVGQRSGPVLSFLVSGTGKLTAPFLDLSKTDTLSLALHPRFAENRSVFVLVARKGATETQGRVQVLRFQVSERAPMACDPLSETVVLEWETQEPAEGMVLFGPDGMLYVSAGDGGLERGLRPSGQDISDLNASILRIDIDQEEEGRPYAIPADNPFVKTPGARGEVWALGVRNPRRMHFDLDGRLWVGDVGKNQYESILLVEPGDNFGWSLFEGGEPSLAGQPLGPGRLKKPAIVHSHREARSIVGGVTYLGERLPELRGAYVYADHITGIIWAARRDSGGVVRTERICDTGRMISSCTTDHDGELLFVDTLQATICTLVPASAVPASSSPPFNEAFPQTLSATELFSNVAGQQPGPGVLPYDINAPLWSDGMVQRRWVAIPGEGRIQFSTSVPWKFPEGTLFIKSAGYPSTRSNANHIRWVETQLLVLQKGRWAGYSYRWNEQGTDAELVNEEGVQARFVETQRGRGEVTRIWNYPSRLECLACHNEASDFILGFQLAQLNRPYGTSPENQLEIFEEWELFQPLAANSSAAGVAKTAPPAVKSRSFPGEPRRSPGGQPSASDRKGATKTRSAPRRVGDEPDAPTATAPGSPSQSEEITKVLDAPAETLPRLVDPTDSAAPLDLRVRSYLHANCGHCHREGGGANSRLRLAFPTPLGEMRLLRQVPEYGTMDLAPTANLVLPGQPDQSVLLARLRRRGPSQMPPLGTHLPDRQGLDLIRAWIESLGAE
ncbi:MAG: PQQ-dependent sugar dehydrogenase [Planctomycetaceae bacterium]